MKHVHRWTYFGGMATCECGSEVLPDGTVKPPSAESRRHQKALREHRIGEARAKNARAHGAEQRALERFWRLLAERI